VGVAHFPVFSTMLELTENILTWFNQGGKFFFFFFSFISFLFSGFSMIYNQEKK